MIKIYSIIKKSLIISTLCTAAFCYSQVNYTFTPCTKTGQTGPSQLMVNTAYASTNLSGSVTVIGSGVQQFTVPASGMYGIRAIGAAGKSTSINCTANGGFGANMYGEFNLTAGQVLLILVGQEGSNAVSGIDQDGGGGGGSFVTTSASVALVVGGGGGGSTNNIGNCGGTQRDGLNASLTTTATNGANGLGVGGVNGTGGTGTGGGGGGGFTTNGTGGSTSGGTSFVNGGSGGVYGGAGGFGGGGGGYSIGGNGGGGGGYSGGGTNSTSNPYSGGGGGGSFNGGINQANVVNNAFGDGKVVITKLCNINLLGNGVANNVAICSGNSLTLTTNAVSNYTWSTTNTTNTLIVVSPLVSQTYSVIGTSTAACQASQTISVTVNGAVPTLTVTNTPNSICLGKTATLTAIGAITYTWAGGPGGVINGQSFLPTATANYTVSGQNGCGITTSVTTITIAPLAVTAAASPSLSCSGSPVTLTVSSAATGYTWSPGPITGSNVIVAPSVNTVYTVTASDGTCSGVATVTLTTKPNPTLSIISSTTTVCQGAVVTMTASGALTYTWTSPNSNAPNISDTPTTATLYQVSGTNSVNCVSSANQIVFTTPSPTVTITSNKSIVCSGDPVTLTASGATTYNWTNGPATAGNVVNPTSNTTYTATGTTSPCSGSQTITINVLTASVLASVNTPSICNGANILLHAGGANTYVWVGLSSSGGNASASPTITTTYTVNATTTSAGLSCPSSTNITVTVFNNPIVTIAASQSVVCKADAPIVLTGGGATTYTWSTSTVSTNINVHPQSTTTYSITGTDANGCVNTASKAITVNACTGIAELNDKKNNISVYPNPSNGEITVQANAEITLSLINGLGQTIRTIDLTESSNYKVSISDLATGIYFLSGQKGDVKINQKVIVTK